jgi:putative ABC transport system permease protein
MIERVLQDLRYAVRTFRRSPGFLLLAVLTIAVGVGANAAIFTIVNAVLLRPLPYPRAGELVLVSESDRQTKRTQNNASPANFLDWRARHHSFTGIAAFTAPTLTLAGAEHPERVSAAMVTANFFDVLGVKPAVGRALAAEDERPGAPRVAVLSDGLWRERFAGRPEVIGQSARFNDEPCIIVGVMPPGVEYPGKSKVWVTPHWGVPDDALAPMQDPSSQRSHGYISTLARLRPSTSLESAQADMDTVAATLEREFPNDNQNVGVTVTSMRDDLVADVRPTILLLFAAVGLLLLIAMANVSGLLIARATARHQEMAVRIALGAGRGRILAQLLTESILLSVIGGAAGVLLAMWLIGPLVSLSPADLGIAGAVAIDRRVLLFGLGLSTIAGLLFGVAPAHQLLRVNVHDDLKQGARGGVSAGQRRVRAVLVAAEIALSLVLLVGASLFVRSFLNAANRRSSPLFLAGEDVGTSRAAGLAAYLNDHQIPVHGVVLLSMTMSADSLAGNRPGSRNDRSRARTRSRRGSASGSRRDPCARRSCACRPPSRRTRRLWRLLRRASRSPP